MVMNTDASLLTSCLFFGTHRFCDVATFDMVLKTVLDCMRVGTIAITHIVDLVTTVSYGGNICLVLTIVPGCAGDARLVNV